MGNNSSFLVLDGAFCFSAWGAYYLARTRAFLGVLQTRSSYDLNSAIAVIQDGGASLKVDTQNLRDISFRTNSTYQFIGELLIKPDNDVVLQARVGRNVDGIDLNLYQQSLLIRRQYEAQLRFLVLDGAFCFSAWGAYYLARTRAFLGVLQTRSSYDLNSAIAVIQDGGASLKVDTQNLRDISFRTNSTYQFIGELLIKPDNDVVLQARVGRNVDGIDLNLYQQSLLIRRQYEAQLRSRRA
uniref:Uncharacterized protein n=1 Tax=Oryza punctata TaxID=4537 RepID=A0A0E0LHD5_ORYPU